MNEWIIPRGNVFEVVWTLDECERGQRSNVEMKKVSSAPINEPALF